MFKNLLRYFWVFFLFLLVASKAFAHHGAHLGKINFVTSGNENARPYFERGVMWLHSFEYAESRADFQMAEKLDPSFAMAYWGDAMTYNHPLWTEQDYVGAIKALNKLAPTAEARLLKAKTEKEKSFIFAINSLYGKGDKKHRDIAYAEAMRKLYQANPNDDEVASFYALALLGATEGERDFRSYMQAAGIAEDIYARNPQHPGAMHYIIHSYDDPVHAPLGLRAARAYAKMAPDASHALHMPSHIYFALGMWDDVIAANKAAWESGVKQNISRDAKAYTIDDLHALHWLSYGYLQKQQYRSAYRLTKTMEEIAIRSNTSMAKWYYALMRAAYLTESKDWCADLRSLDMTRIELSARATDLYENAVQALKHDDINGARQIVNELTQIIPKHINHQATYQNYFTAVLESGVLAVKIIRLELQAKIKFCQGKIKQAIELLKNATKMEDSLSFGYGPPVPVKPAYELLADMLLYDKQYKAAYLNYVFSLKRTPNRFYSEKGLQIARDKLKAAGLEIPTGIKPYFHRLMKPDFYQ